MPVEFIQWTWFYCISFCSKGYQSRRYWLLL